MAATMVMQLDPISMTRTTDGIGTSARPEGPRDRGVRVMAFALAAMLQLVQQVRGRAEDVIAYRYENYREDAGRVAVDTQTAYFETTLNPRVAVKGQFVYDAISGATPTGGPPAAGDTQVPLVALHDQRHSGSISSDLKAGRTTTTPGFAYSTESDYESYGVSLNEAVDLNQRNTTLNFGAAHNFDRVKGFYQQDWKDKGSTDVLVGVNQLIGPHTYVTFNVTLGYSDGYLTDPYKGVNFTYRYPISFYDPADVDVNAPERRPGHKFRQVAMVGFTHYVEAVRGSADISYRFHHDDWGIFSQTVEVAWHQKLGKQLMVSPLFRFYNQTAADFYATRFNGDPSFPGGAVGAAQKDGSSIVFNDDPSFPGDAAGTFAVPVHPANYSSDYRLSRLQTFTYGVVASWRIHENLSLEAAYKRYEMVGLDGVTLASAYPGAHIFTLGFDLHF